MPPKFFVTHSWKDIEFAHRLCDDLQASGLEGFFDAHSMSPGDSIPTRIERGLKECDVYIPVFSPDALKSDWCDWEIDIAITMNRTRKGQPRIIPVIAQPCTVPTRLMHLLYINFVGRYDEALDELLTKGFDLPAIRPAPPAPLEHSVVSPPVPRKNWLLPFGAVVAVALIVLIAARAVFVVPPATPTPPSVAGLISSTPTAVLTLPLVAVIATGTPMPATPTSAPQSTNTRVPTSPSPTSTRTPTATPSLIPGLAIGSTKTARDGALMMFVPAGEFLMGSNEADQNARTDEKPQHTVYLDAFWISKYEVTNALYKKCVDAGRCPVPKSWASGAIPTGKENHPVGSVSWSDAAAYAQWLGGRLPTEAEWEKAACWDETKKVKRIYPWGEVFDAGKANTAESGSRGTTPVGMNSPQGDSPYGASDMAGNVSEWVADWYDVTYYSNSPKNNPKGADSGNWRVLRGGAWNVNQSIARCAVRYGSPPDGWSPVFGFRVVVSSSPNF